MRFCLGWSSVLLGLSEVKIRDGILKETGMSLKHNQAAKWTPVGRDLWLLIAIDLSRHLQKQETKYANQL